MLTTINLNTLKIKVYMPHCNNNNKTYNKLISNLTVTIKLTNNLTINSNENHNNNILGQL